jgi:hypothetical protein
LSKAAGYLGIHKPRTQAMAAREGANDLEHEEEEESPRRRGSATEGGKGSDWVRDCSSKSNEVRQQCWAYTHGVADGIIARDLTVGKGDGLACFPTCGVPTEQLVSVGMNFIKGDARAPRQFAAVLLSE